MAERSWYETLEVEGKDLVDRVNRLIEEGNVRRIILKQDEKVLFEIPLSAGVAVGVVTLVFAPVLAAVAAAAALVAKCTVVVERVEDVPGAGESPLHASVDHAQPATPPHADTAGEQQATQL
jgi:hypothetical protein